MTERDWETLVTRLLIGIDQWSEAEDGVPADVWDAYVEARIAVGHPLVTPTEGAMEGRYQLLEDAIAGLPWPPEEES